MKETTNCNENIFLGKLFLVGAVAIYAGYYLGFTEVSGWSAKFFCSVAAFVLEFCWLTLVALYAKTTWDCGKLLFLNLPVLTGLVGISVYLSKPYVSSEAALIKLAILVGVCFFLFGWLALFTIVKYKKILPEDDEQQAENPQNITSV